MTPRNLSAILLLEAAIAGVPASFFIGFYFPLAVVFSVFQEPTNSAISMSTLGLIACAGVFALCQYWLLAIRTAKSQPHPLGLAFWSAAAVSAPIVLVLVYAGWWIGLVAILPVAAACHFVRLQKVVHAQQAIEGAHEQHPR